MPVVCFRLTMPISCLLLRQSLTRLATPVGSEDQQRQQVALGTWNKCRGRARALNLLSPEPELLVALESGSQMIL